MFVRFKKSVNHSNKIIQTDNVKEITIEDSDQASTLKFEYTNGTFITLDFASKPDLKDALHLLHKSADLNWMKLNKMGDLV